MEKENRNKLIQIIVSAVLLAAAYIVGHFVSLPLWAQLLTYLPAYAVVGYEVIIEAFEGITEGEVFGEEFLMTIATVGALVIGFLPDSEPMFAEAVFVMLFFQVGELFEELAEDKSRRSVSELMDIRPDSANVERGGKTITVAPSDVKVGETVVVRPGERIPLDGVIIEGTSTLNTVALTGESAPRDAKAGDDVVSGCINQSGVIRVRTTKEYGESTVAKILEMVEDASDRKSKSENFIKKFARCYTPCVVISAVILAIVPSIIWGGFTSWLTRALTFLVVSCPCALVISVPLAFFCGIGGASRKGILIKGSDYLEALTKTGVAGFDKTGTLTKGVFEVTAIHPDDCDADTLLHLAAHVERYSTHPIAVSLRQAYPHEADSCDVENVTEISGQGVTATVNGKRISVGNTLLMDSVGAKWHPCHHVGTTIHVAIDGEYAGHIIVSDKVKNDAASAIAELKALGVEKTVMLTGDRNEVAEIIAKELKLDEYHADLLPADKVAAVEKLAQTKPAGKTLVYAGDGINDAPVLARADVGVAMGALGSDAAIESADVVLMDDKPSKLASAIKIARFTLGIVKQNIVLSLLVKFAVLILAMFGKAPMWLAVFADVGVTVLAVLNSMRASSYNPDK